MKLDEEIDPEEKKRATEAFKKILIQHLTEHVEPRGAFAILFSGGDISGAEKAAELVKPLMEKEVVHRAIDAALVEIRRVNGMSVKWAQPETAVKRP